LLVGGIISTTRLRLAAGICVLSASLFIGSAGGAIASADTDSTDSTGSPSQSQGAEAPSSAPGAASASAESVAHPLQDTLQATVQSALRTLRKWQQRQQQSTHPQQSQTEPAAANTEGDEAGSAPTTVAPSPPASESNAPASDSTEVATDSAPPATDPVAPSANDPVAPLANDPPSPPANDPPSPPATVVGPVALPATVVGPPSPPPTVVGPVNPPQVYLAGIANAVATVANVAMTVPGVFASLPTSLTPVADVITLVQEMLTSVTNVVVQLLQVPADLFSLLGMTPVTAVATVKGGVGAAASALLLATPASRWLDVSPAFLFGGAPLPDRIAPLATVGEIATTGLRHELPVSGIASPAQNVVEQTGLGSFLEHTVSAILVPASLSALAAVALPGVGGLLIICLVGMRFGYRQAKALLEVRRAGIACFAGPGPLGVVRSASLIALRPRASRVVRPEAQRAAPLLEQAA
jgi:hypothetical protein